MELNLGRTISDNKKEETIAVSAFNSGQGLVLALPGGAAHENITLKDGSDVDLVHGTDWIYGHRSRHALKTYGINAFGSIILLKTGLVGSVKATVDYLGGGYQDYDNTGFPYVQDRVDGAFPVMYWDYGEDYPYVSSEDPATIPAGSIKTSIKDVISILGIFGDIESGGIDDSRLESVIQPLVDVLQDKVDSGLNTVSKDVVGAINEVLTTIEGAATSSRWGYDAEFLGDLYLEKDVSGISRSKPGYYRVWGESIEIAYAALDDSVKRENYTYGDLVYFVGDGTSRVLMLTKETEPLTRANRLLTNVRTNAKTLSGAINELNAKAGRLNDNQHVVPAATSDFDLTGVNTPYEYQLYPIGVESVTVTGSFRDNTTTKVVGADDVIVLFDDGKLEKRAVSEYVELTYPTINPDIDSGERTVIGLARTVGATVAGKGLHSKQVIRSVGTLGPKSLISQNSEGVTDPVLNAIDEDYSKTGMLSDDPIDSNYSLFNHINHPGVSGRSYTTCGLFVDEKRKLYIRGVKGASNADGILVYKPDLSGFDVHSAPRLSGSPMGIGYYDNRVYYVNDAEVVELNLDTNAEEVIYTHPVSVSRMVFEPKLGGIYLYDANNALTFVDVTSKQALSVASNLDDGVMTAGDYGCFIQVGTYIRHYRYAQLISIVDFKVRIDKVYMSYSEKLNALIGSKWTDGKVSICAFNLDTLDTTILRIERSSEYDPGHWSDKGAWWSGASSTLAEYRIAPYITNFITRSK